MKIIGTINSMKQKLAYALVVLTTVFAPLLYLNHASAAALGVTFVRFDRLQISTPTTGTVCVNPATIASTEAKVAVTFPTGYTLGAFGTFTVNTTNLSWPTVSGLTTTAWPSIVAPASGAAIVGQTVTFGSGDLTSATALYCFNWTSSTAVSTASGASSQNTGTVTTQTSAPATIDTGTYSAATIAGDQIAVTATVNPIFSFALSGTGDALGNLTTTTVAHSPTPRTITIGTNAKNGWATWAQSALTGGGLRSTTASYTIPATTCTTGTSVAGVVTAGTEGYNTGVTATHSGGTGTVTVVTAFDGTTTNHGAGLCGNLNTIATSSGTANSDVLTLTNNAAISNSTPPATDYTDTITVTGAGLF